MGDVKKEKGNYGLKFEEKPERPDSDYDKHELSLGRDVEKEHTTNKGIAEEIAKDHLDEHTNYYDKLIGLFGETSLKERKKQATLTEDREKFTELARKSAYYAKNIMDVCNSLIEVAEVPVTGANSDVDEFYTIVDKETNYLMGVLEDLAMSLDDIETFSMSDFSNDLNDELDDVDYDMIINDMNATYNVG